MIFDNKAIFSDKQAITADAASTNVIDMGAAGKTYLNQQLKRAAGVECIPFALLVTEAFDNLTSLKIAIQGSTDEAFTSPVEVAAQTVLLADLKVGKKFPFPVLPSEMKGLRYLRMYYDVTGTAPTAGEVTAGIVGAVDQGYYGNV